MHGKGKVLVAHASWSDPGFIADWYPRNLPASERLPYYAGYFNFVELNSSFYAIPVRRMVDRWCQQTPDDFIFDVKMYRLLSRHATMANTLPRVLRSKAQVQNTRLVLTPELEEAVTLHFLSEIKPFQECGKMGALLLQLSPSFEPRKHRLEELDSLLALLKGHKVAIELRNRNWVVGEQLSATTEYFSRYKISFVSVDAPESKHFMVMPRLDLVTNPELAYMRLHGRNAHNFITGKSVAERFDYDYSESELHEIADRVAKIAQEVPETHVVYNNNSSDYALRAAARFQKILDEEYRQSVQVKPPPIRPVQPTFNFR